MQQKENINKNMNFNGRAAIVKNVQSKLGLVVDGKAGIKTWTAICTYFGIKYPGTIQKSIQEVQKFLGLVVDLTDGPNTWNTINGAIKSISSNIPSAPPQIQKPKEDEVSPVTRNPYGISERAFKLILKHEVGGGEDYYRRFLSKPSYPGGASGVTIGIGYDLGYNTLQQFKHDWERLLPKRDFDALASTLGKRSKQAAIQIRNLRGVEITWEAAREVFISSTLPRFIEQTLRVFPDSDKKLPPDAFGALVSLVFNRGSSVAGPTRQEMLNIRRALLGEIKVENLQSYIAKEIVGMKRLWVGRGLDGLLRRRDEEAAMVFTAK
jgi:hypothetical protein